MAALELSHRLSPTLQAAPQPDPPASAQPLEGQLLPLRRQGSQESLSRSRTSLESLQSVLGLGPPLSPRGPHAALADSTLAAESAFLGLQLNDWEVQPEGEKEGLACRAGYSVMRLRQQVFGIECGGMARAFHKQC